MLELRQKLKLGKFTTLDLLEFIKAVAFELSAHGRVSGKQLFMILKDREITFDATKADLIARTFLQSKGSQFVLFAQYLAGRKNSHRGTMLTKLWTRLDLYNHGHTQYIKLLSSFKASRHPDARARKVSPQELSLEFKETLETFEEVKGMIVGHGQGAVRELQGRPIAQMILNLHEFEVFFWLYCFEEDDAYKFEQLFNSVFSMGY